MSSNDEAEKAIEEFAKITGVNEALSHFFLQEYDYNLQVSFNLVY